MGYFFTPLSVLFHLGYFFTPLRVLKVKHEFIAEHASDLVVAVVINENFSKDLKNETIKTNKTRVYPFDLVNFQIPEVLVIDRKPAVSLCINYVHRYLTGLPFFLDLQKDFQIDKIQMYDAESTLRTLKFVKENSPKYDFVDVEEYNLNEKIMCAFIDEKYFASTEVSLIFLKYQSLVNLKKETYSEPIQTSCESKL